MSDDTVRVAFIGGHGRSGSTLLSRLLGQVDGICTLGELRNVWDAGVLRDFDCACGQTFSRCEFWGSLGHKAFGGWDRQLAERALTLRRQVDRVRAVPRLALEGSRPVRATGFGREADEYADLLARIYVAAAELTGARVVVDSSKVPSTGWLMRRSERLEPRVVHLVRDSRGVAYSWTKVVQRADTGGTRTMARSTPARTALRWETFNRLTAALRRAGLPTLLVRYEDLVAAPRRELDRVTAFLDVSQPDLGFVRGTTVDLAVGHSMWGNPGRSATGPQSLRLDDAWRRELPARQRRIVTAVSAAGLRRYGYVPDRTEVTTDA